MTSGRQKGGHCLHRLQPSHKHLLSCCWFREQGELCQRLWTVVGFPPGSFWGLPTLMLQLPSSGIFFFSQYLCSSQTFFFPVLSVLACKPLEVWYQKLHFIPATFHWPSEPRKVGGDRSFVKKGSIRNNDVSLKRHSQMMAM